MGENNGSAAVLDAPSALLTNTTCKGGKMALAEPKLPRQAISVRTRFEVFKRDDFTCRYCGRATPYVVLQIDHIVPVCDGGTNDEMNLVTACWECNSGKSDVPLNEVLTGEDPHDKAILLLEKRRQLQEYDVLLGELLNERQFQAQRILNFWCKQTGKESIPTNQFTWLVNQLQTVPMTMIQEAMLLAISRDMTRDWRYVMVVIRNWREDGKHLGSAEAVAGYKADGSTRGTT